MFNLLVSAVGWNEPRGVLPLERVFKYTPSNLPQHFQSVPPDQLPGLFDLPSLFMTETGGKGSQFARVGKIVTARVEWAQLHLEFSIDATINPIANAQIESVAVDLNAVPFEFIHTHWAIKDVDLFRVLFRAQTAPVLKPKVFNLDPLRGTEPALVAAMMPFDRKFDQVYAAIQAASAAVNMRCQRADDIWQHDAIIQDIVSLIHASRIVVCDCTGRNANVFYEAGIAHTLGRDVILITQAADDIPFDLRHIRFIQYLDNDQGRADLVGRLSERLRTLTAQVGRP